MSEPEVTVENEVKERTARIVRRLGYVVFMGGGLLIFVPMIIAVASGIKNDRIWEPMTGQAVVRQGSQTDCSAEARQLIQKADDLPKLTSDWDALYRGWLLRCQSENPGLFDLLRETRQALRKHHP